jgi:hypothetical protein
MSVNHPLFGKLKYKEDGWRGRATLPLFAAVGRMPEAEPMTQAEAEQLEADMTDAIAQMRAAMQAKFGGVMDEMFAAIDQEMAKAETEPDEPDPREEERERRRAEREAKAAARLAKGLFPVRVADVREDGPSEQQEAAYSHLVANEQAVFDAVAQQVFESFEAYDAQDDLNDDAPEEIRTPADLAGQYAVMSVEICREHHDGTSYLVFGIDCPWEVEHGMYVVYHPAKPAAWTTYDGLYDLVESDEPVEEVEPTPEEELFWAVREGDDEKARQLIAAGVDINAGSDEGDDEPPLLFAVENLEPDFVRQLLKHGADPNVTKPGKKTTPLRLARRMYREYGFAPSKKDKLLGAMMAFAQEAAPEAMSELKGQ